MKQSKKNTTPKSTKRKSSYTSVDELPDEVKNAIKNMKVTYTVRTVSEHISPSVKKLREEQKKNQQE